MTDNTYYLNTAKNVLMEIKKSVVGKDEVICKIMMAILARGHVLIEDIPGVGKTTMALAFAETLVLKCNRVQFTPDVIPSDIVGFNMYNRATNKFEYKAGAADCNILLADEISPDSCRFWDKQTDKKLDKDVFRQDLGSVKVAYEEVLRRILG